VESCAQRLREAILGGEVAAGSLLPPERALAVDLGVNRTTLRAAIQRLVEIGLLDAQQGRGTLVRDFRQHAGVEILATVVDRIPEEAGALATAWNEAALARDLLHVRRCLARGVLEALVDARPGQTALDRVRGALARFEAVVVAGGDAEALAVADVAVVSAVVEATDRPGLRLCMNPVLRTLSQLPRLRRALYARPSENVAAFRALLPFLESPNPALIEPVLQAMAARDADTLARLS
jgi:DNA-binding FadR family transcriptional regulator